MDPAIVVVALGILAVIVLERRRRRGGEPFDLTDLMSGLFNSSHDPGWPRGVQEEDTIRPWGATESPAADADSPVAGGRPAEPVGRIEECLDPIPVRPVQRAA